MPQAVASMNTQPKTEAPPAPELPEPPEETELPELPETQEPEEDKARALAFDSAALYGTSSPFGSYINQTSKVVSLADPGGAGVSNLNAYDALAVNGLGLLLAGGKKWNGTLLDDTAEVILNGAKDGNGRPLFIESPYDLEANPYREGRIIGRPTVLSDHVANGTTVGFMGDFTQVLWGQVGGLSYDVTAEATLNLGTVGSPNFVSLWQHNLIAVRVEAEFGLLVNDPQAFVRLTNVVTA
jgi:hypothetical protein